MAPTFNPDAFVAGHPASECGNDCLGTGGHGEGCPVHCFCYEDETEGDVVSLVNEAAVDAAAQRALPEGVTLADLTPPERFALREKLLPFLVAAAPHIGGEAIRQAVAAVQDERAVQLSVKAFEGGNFVAGYSRALDDVLKHAEVKP